MIKKYESIFIDEAKVVILIKKYIVKKIIVPKGWRDGFWEHMSKKNLLTHMGLSSRLNTSTSIYG